MTTYTLHIRRISEEENHALNRKDHLYGMPARVLALYILLHQINISHIAHGQVIRFVAVHIYYYILRKYHITYMTFLHRVQLPCF